MTENLKKKVLLIVLPPLVLFLVLLVFFALINNDSLKIPFISEKPSPYPTLSPLVGEEAGASPSAYVNDDGVKKIESFLKSLEKDLEIVDLDELSLRPPLLDLEVEY